VPGVSSTSSVGERPVDPGRAQSYGEATELTFLDHLGVWLGTRHTRRRAGDLAGKALGDFGCGYDARFTRAQLPTVRHATLADVSLASDLKANPKVTAVEGALPDAITTLPDGGLDTILCISMLEHLWEPERMLRECRRLLAPGGRLLVSVPTWLDKRLLEFVGFRLHVNQYEIDDHKRYYTRRDLWKMLRGAGFLPSRIRCRRYKFGLAIFAVASAPER
jgi:SAM-dependent methyltransferase